MCVCVPTVRYKHNFISYDGDTTIASPSCSFAHGANNVISHVSLRINSELLFWLVYGQQTVS